MASKPQLAQDFDLKKAEKEAKKMAKKLNKASLENALSTKEEAELKAVAAALGGKRTGVGALETAFSDDELKATAAVLGGKRTGVGALEEDHSKVDELKSKVKKALKNELKEELEEANKMSDMAK